MVDYQNLDVFLDSSVDYSELVSLYGDSAQSLDTIINKTFDVLDISVSDKNIFCSIDDGVMVGLETSKELEWFYRIFLSEYKFSNRKSLLDFIEEERDVILSKLDIIRPKIRILEVDNIVIGSIIDCHLEELTNSFFNQLKVIGSYTSISDPVLRDNLLQNIIVYPCVIRLKNAGGYVGNILGLDVFIPNSMLYRKQDGTDYLPGDVVKVVIENYVKDKQMFIVSNLRYVQMIIPSILPTMDLTKKMTGNIVGVSNFGLFISFNDVLYGLLHISDMLPETIEKYNNREYSVGDQIDFYVKEYKDNKLVLSELSIVDIENNWNKNVEKYKGRVFNFKAIKEIKSGFLFEFDDSRVRGFLYDAEVRRYQTQITIGNVYPVYVYDMDRVTGKVYLKCPN